MNNLDTLRVLRQTIYKDTSKYFENYLEVFHTGMSLVLDASDMLVEKEKESDHRTSDGASKLAAWRFISTMPTSVIWCNETALCGDYGIAKNILRLSLEEFVKLVYYVTFPDKALRQVNHDRDKDEVDLASMLKQLDFEGRQGLLKLHGDLSAFYSHANLNLPQEMVYHIHDEQIQLGGGPRFAPELFEPIIQQLIIIVANTIKYMVIRFPYILDTEEWRVRFEEFVPKAASMLPD